MRDESLTSFDFSPKIARSEVCLALRSQLADEDVVRLDLGADPDDTFFVELLEHVAREVRDIPCDFLRSELCVSGFALMLLDVERCEYVVHEQSLVEDDSVLVVVAFPCHESDQEILSEGDLAQLMQVPWLERLNLSILYSSTVPSSSLVILT